MDEEWSKHEIRSAADWKKLLSKHSMRETFACVDEEWSYQVEDVKSLTKSPRPVVMYVASSCHYHSLCFGAEELGIGFGAGGLTKEAKNMFRDAVMRKFKEDGCREVVVNISKRIHTDFSKFGQHDVPPMDF